MVEDLENFDFLKKKITEKLEFDCRNYSDSFLTRRIDTRLRYTGIKSYKEYALFLDKDKAEHEKLDKELTIHVTDFFRDKSMWDIFKNEVIPELIKDKNSKSDTKIRIWSAGCSTGEEPYTIAICFHEALGNKIYEYDIRIIGTDYDLATVQKGRQGIYNENKLKDVEKSIMEKYFEKDSHNYTVKDFLKKCVELNKGDIFTSAKPKNLDIIFCRNTVIYFDSEAKSRLYVEFYDSLRKDGFFIMGKTEILLGESRKLFKVFDGAERIFQKD